MILSRGFVHDLFCSSPRCFCLSWEDDWSPFKHSAPLFPETPGTCTSAEYQSICSQVESVTNNDFNARPSWRESEEDKRELADVTMQLSESERFVFVSLMTQAFIQTVKASRPYCDVFVASDIKVE